MGESCLAASERSRAPVWRSAARLTARSRFHTQGKGTSEAGGSPRCPPRAGRANGSAGPPQTAETIFSCNLERLTENWMGRTVGRTNHLICVCGETHPAAHDAAGRRHACSTLKVTPRPPEKQPGPQCLSKPTRDRRDQIPTVASARSRRPVAQRCPPYDSASRAAAAKPLTVCMARSTRHASSALTGFAPRTAVRSESRRTGVCP